MRYEKQWSIGYEAATMGPRDSGPEVLVETARYLEREARHLRAMAKAGVPQRPPQLVREGQQEVTR